MRFRLAVVAVAAVVVYLGASRLKDMPVDAVPDFTKPYVELQTEALGLAPED